MLRKKRDPSAERQVLRRQLADALAICAENCIECKLCSRQCYFLQKYGTPKYIAASYDPASQKDLFLAFECSLCGLCRAVCPVKIDPCAMFLEMRRETALRHAQNFSRYRKILNYEKRGTSRLFSYYGLPEKCDTVLFPGCALPGTRPDRVKDLFYHLSQSIPRIGIVLDCCTKPSHDLGRDDYFRAIFGEMRDYLLRYGVRNVLVACPNCHKVFKGYGDGLHVKTVYEYLADVLPQERDAKLPAVTIHDPCGTRDEEQVQKAVRQIAAKKSLPIEEMKHKGRQTICCGEGGTVACVNPDFSGKWSMQRHTEAGEKRIVTYCAGCANYLSALHPTFHILDFIYAPHATLAGTISISRSPWTYLNRLFLKRYFKKNIQTAVSRERIFRLV